MAKKYPMTIEEDLVSVALKQRKTWGQRSTDASELFDKKIIVFSLENFGEEILTPFGHLDGETGHREREFFIAGDYPVNIFGEVISDIEFCSGDFAPNHIYEEDDCDDYVEDEKYWRSPAWSRGIDVYRKDKRKEVVTGKVVFRN